MKIMRHLKKGTTYFYKNTGLQNQFILYRYKENIENAKVFLDPNFFAEDGTTLSWIEFFRGWIKSRLFHL